MPREKLVKNKINMKLYGYILKFIILTQKLYWKVLGASMGNPAHGKGHEERGLTNTKLGSGLRGPSRLSWASTPQNRVCLLYCVMLSTYSSNLNRGLSPHHLFLEKVNLQLLDKSPGHNKSVSIQNPLWWLSSLPDRFVQTLTAVHVIVCGLRTREAQEA